MEEMEALDLLPMLTHFYLEVISRESCVVVACLRKCTGPNNIRDPVTGFTCLHHAALNGHLRCVELIVAGGAKLNAVDYKGSSALHLAAWAGNLDMVRLLLDCRSPGGELNRRSAGCEPLVLHRPTGTTLQNKASPAARSAALAQGELANAAFQEVDINLTNNDKQTALSLAAQFGHNDVVGELLKHGADVHLRNSRLESALDLACLNGRLETVRLLLDSAPELVDELRRPRSTILISLASHSNQQVAADEQRQQATSSSRHPLVSGWSSLLRSGSGGSKSQTIVNTKSSRSAASDQQQQFNGRRATLAAGQLASDQQRPSDVRQRAQQLSFDSAGSLASPDNGRMQMANDCLLDHAPLHYAVRRCHANVVNLLLSQYNANVVQVTSLGSVLHELAMGCVGGQQGEQQMGAGVRSDMLNLFVAHLIQHTSGNFDDTKREWESLLSVRNSQGRSVFDFLLMSEQNPSAKSRRLAQKIQLFIWNMNKQLDKLCSGSDDSAMRRPTPASKQLFATSQQMSSFVTMKRVPKSSQNNAHVPLQQISFNHQLSMPNGTQTIDRRTSRRAAPLSCQPMTSRQQQQHPPAYEQHLFNSYQDQHHHHHHSQQQQVPTLTRSVSNLIREDHSAPPARHWTASGDFSSVQNDHSRNIQLFHSQMDELARQQQAFAIMEARKSRSRSRDLGPTALTELEDVKRPAGQHYDNEPLPSRLSAQQHDAAMGAARGQLVRSQTDCSHLMSKFFGSLSGRAGAQADSSPAFSGQQQQNQQQQQQHQRSENSSLVSVNNGARLAPTRLAGHSATLDRRAINRHYHVYEHEFYPPRLVSTTQAEQQPAYTTGARLAEEKQRQAIAIVPPLARQLNEDQQQCNRQPIGRPDPLVNNIGRPLLQLRLLRRQQQPQLQQRDSMVSDASRHQEQMDRFVSRLAQKTNNAELTIDTGEQREQQHRQTAGSMNGSQSLESHLGQSAASSSAASDQSHLFEWSRRALMRDFDLMLGRELLNCRDQCDMPPTSAAGSSSSSHSILTGVSLDMDTRGERLTVSGTRVTMPGGAGGEPAAGQQLFSSSSLNEMQVTQSSASSDDSPRLSQPLCSDGSDREQLNQQQLDLAREARRRPPRPAQPPLARSKTLATKVANSSSDAARIAPQKPPRPSLKSQQKYKSLQGNPAAAAAAASPPDDQSAQTRSPRQQCEPVIYDLPSTSGSLDSSQHLQSGGPLRPGSRASLASSNIIMTPSMQPVSSTKHQAGQALTQAPRGKPPPPPPPPTSSASQKHTVTPLDVVASDHYPGPSSLESRLSQLSAPDSQANFGQPPCSASSSSSCSFAGAEAHQKGDPEVAGHAARGAAAHPTSTSGHDVDSGVCTSNSPASLSHDSDGTTAARVNSTQAASSQAANPRCQQTAPADQPNSRSCSSFVAPPSPRTAQMSIEEALVPLEDNAAITLETANQTSFELKPDVAEQRYHVSDSLRNSINERGVNVASLSAQVEMIFGWLGATSALAHGRHKSSASVNTEAYADDQLAGAGYENCLDLQRKLLNARCRSIGNLFNGLAEQTGATTVPASVSVAPASSSTDELDDDDYVASSDVVESNSPRSSSSDTLQSPDDVETDDQRESNAGAARKEIILKVLVDERAQATSGDEVFYIEPSELKRIANLNGKSDAGTLTDEELCASVDKESGYIKFTLKKRRGLAKEIEAASLDGDQAVLAVDRDSMPIESQNEQALSFKRAKLNEAKQDECSSEKCATSPKISVVDQDVTTTTTDENDREQEVGPGDKAEDVEQVVPEAEVELEARDGAGASDGGQQQQQQPSVCPARKASADSIQLDASQASSSSSEVSIKSIVSFKTQRTNSIADDPIKTGSQQTGDSDECQAHLRRAVVSEKHGTSTSGSPPHGEPTAKSARAITAKPRIAAKSIVCETARKLEAAAAAANTANSMKSPIAALRKFNGRPNSIDMSMKEAGRTEEASGLAKRSICWPPRRAAGDGELAPSSGDASDENHAPIAATMGRVTANRLSFQKMIEESSVKNNTAFPNRPKPAPPIKPAGLAAANRFKTPT